MSFIPFLLACVGGLASESDSSLASPTDPPASNVEDLQRVQNDVSQIHDELEVIRVCLHARDVGDVDKAMWCDEQLSKPLKPLPE